MKRQLEISKEQAEQTEAAEKKTHKSKKKKPAFDIFDIAESLVNALLILVVVMTFAVRMVVVKGPSMKPTLQDGDRLLVSSLFYKPERGDVVVLTGAAHYENPLVKRVVAVGGDTVDIDFDTGLVTVNGKHEIYTKGLTYDDFDIEFPLTVPKGKLFVLGDNRGESLDSRSSAIGCIDERYVIGKVLGRIYPIGRWEVQ